MNTKYENSSSIASFFTSTASVNLTHNMAPLGGGEWGEIEEDPEMRADDDFLEFYNSHSHPTGWGPGNPLIGHVSPISGNTDIGDGTFNLPTDNGVYQIIQDIADPHEVDVDEDYVSWECMRCHIVLAPHVDSCERCAPPWSA